MYCETIKRENFLDKKRNAKLTKQSYNYKGYASSYVVDNLNYFNLELRLEDSESVITNKRIVFMTELRDFKFVKTVFIEFNKIGTDDATKYTILLVKVRDIYKTERKSFFGIIVFGYEDKKKNPI